MKFAFQGKTDWHAFHPLFFIFISIKWCENQYKMLRFSHFLLMIVVHSESRN